MAKILLAKAECAVREHLLGTLNRAGHSVAVCERGDVAYDMLRVEAFDIVLCDVAAVGMDALSLAAKAADVRPEARIMLIAGFAALAVDAAAGRKPAPACSKPVHLRALPDHLNPLRAA